MFIDTKKAKILIVDDQQLNISLLTKIMNNEGYHQVTGLTDSREVIPSYAAHDYDIVLLDIRMPHMDGMQVLEQINLVPKEAYVPVVVLTAQDDKETKLRALQLGAKDFLTKPFDQAEVLLRVNNLLETRLMHKQQCNLNRVLDRKVKERTDELKKTRLEVIRRLGRAAEFRDNETGFHIIRMSKYAQIIARKYGLSDHIAELILNASPMHDIGKIGIPDSILLKPGKLDKEEWEIMKTHAAIGAEILSGHDSELMIMASEIAQYHHEKYDGSGYPQGLAGDDIPISAQIAALSDVFDALTSVRPYKKAWPVEDAVEEIKKSSGSHFNPMLVQAFLDSMPEILEVRNKYRESDVDFEKNTYASFMSG